MNKIKKCLIFGTLFVLVDLLFVCGTILSVILYDYFSGRELVELYQNEYGSALILSLLFAISTMLCVVLFVVGRLIYKNSHKIKAWTKYNAENEKESEHKGIDFMKEARKNLDLEMFHLSNSSLYLGGNHS